MKILFSSLLALLFAGKLFAADVASDFAAADKFYAEGKFAGAAAAYNAILQTGAASPALWFNYGNAEFKLGKLGPAIAAFRRAELLAPRDAEIRANLAFVRNQVQGATLHESRWQDWLGQLTLNEWTLLTAGAFWLALLSLAARQIRPALVPRLKSATALFAALTVLSSAVLGVQAEEHFSKSTAVVIAGEASARSGPFDDAQTVFSVRSGAELAVLDRRGDWVQVSSSSEGINGYGKTGWLSNKQIEVLPGA